MPIIFYDLETFGLSPAHDRIAEFAGILTDDSLELLEQPYELRCLPPPDYLAQPEASLTTGITPQMALQTGLAEPDFARKVYHWFTAHSDTLILGYNNVSFDDEFIRHLFYRTFMEPYGWHFRNGNRRMDLFTVMPAIFDFHRETLSWPRTETGAPDFRLEALATANDALGGTSHEALADTFALRNITKLIVDRAPDVWRSLPTFFDKNTVERRLDHAFRNGLVVIYSSARFRSENRASSFFTVLGREPGPAGQWWLLDVSRPAKELLDMEPEDVFSRWFSRERPEPFRLLQRVNPRRFPCVLPVGKLQEKRMEELGLPRELVSRNIDLAEGAGIAGWARRLVDCFSENKAADVPVPPDATTSSDPMASPGWSQRDVDGRLYDGFLPDSDRAQVAGIEDMSTPEIAGLVRTASFTDDRYQLLARRYIGRYTPGRLSSEERHSFRLDAASRLDVLRFDEAWNQAIADMANDPETSFRSRTKKRKILSDLKDHRNSVVRRMGLEEKYGTLQ